MTRTNLHPGVPATAPAGPVPPIENDGPVMDQFVGWTPLPRSAIPAGITVRVHSRVYGGIVLLFDQHGLELCGFRPGQHVAARISPDGKQIVLARSGVLKIDTDLTTKGRRAGFVGKLVLPGLLFEGEGMNVLGVRFAEDGAAILSLPRKTVLG